MGESGYPARPRLRIPTTSPPSPPSVPAGAGSGLGGRNHAYSVNHLNGRALILYSFYFKLPRGLGKERTRFLCCAFAV